jgi:hypothetical protein
MTNLSLTELATIAHDSYYATILTLDDLNAYLRAELMIRPDDSITSRDDLLTALDTDIHDLLHNANLSDLLPFAADLDLDEYDALNDRIDCTEFTNLIADLILAPHPPDLI